MDVAFTHRFRAGNEELRADDFARTEWVLDQSRRAIDLADEQAFRPRPVRGRGLLLIDLRHERRPGGRGEDAALRVRLDLRRAIETHPDPGDEIRRIADVPDVGAVVGRSGLARRRHPESRAPD